MRIYFRAVVLAFVMLTFFTVTNGLCQECELTVFQKIDEFLAHGENQQAWQLLLELPEDAPDATEKLWRMARTQYEIGRLLSDQEGLSFFIEAEKYARAAIATDQNNGESYKWLAITLGAQSKHYDSETQIRQSWEIKESIDKAIALNPDDDISYLVLSRWHYKISALGWFSRTIAKMIYGELPKASLDKAESLLWQAIKLHDRIAHRYNLAKVYNRMDQQHEAVAQLELALLLPVTFPEEEEELRKSRAKLEEWQ
jgi:tetratricopeptide (TPR) repeat protein